ncbi:CoA transferase [Devosia sp. Root635]|uniref:CoA transferase n=1 Tax=Devosia sp. Root635 TaxID=1736575 RepID=UPI0006F761EC|nr:CoA transferase [Devosia sp. Root635]KRA43243.1 carnitine dehydratase [Devosia sp. Root635]
MSMLAGLKVLEIADGLTDFGGRMLAELGADVTVVLPEAPQEKSRERAWHHGKTRVTADSAEAIRALAQSVDIILDGQRNGDRFNLATTVNPTIIYVKVTPFSPTGPYAGRPASDLTLFALSGLMHVTGDPTGTPLKFPGQQAYALTGIQAATAALMALYARRKTGKGQGADLSAFQSTTLANYREAVMYEWTGRIGRRQGNLLVRGKSGVRQIWPCKDGYVTWSMIDNPSMMRAVVGVMIEQGAAGELSEIDWGNILVADTAQETIERWQAVFGTFFAAHTRSELGRWSLERGWGLSVIMAPDDVRDSDHLAARGLFVPVTDEATGESVNLPGPLFHSAAMDAPRRSLAKPVPASTLAAGAGR